MTTSDAMSNPRAGAAVAEGKEYRVTFGLGPREPVERLLATLLV